jgi:hypothetical protein
VDAREVIRCAELSSYGLAKPGSWQAKGLVHASKRELGGYREPGLGLATQPNRRYVNVHNARQSINIFWLNYYSLCMARVGGGGPPFICMYVCMYVCMYMCVLIY